MNENDMIFFDDATDLGRGTLLADIISSDLHVVSGQSKDTELARISTLSDVFLEWYLFDSSKEKDLKTFLDNECIQDIFTETDFMDLICGVAYLDRNLLQYVTLKLPFYIKPNRIRFLNANVGYINPSARVINYIRPDLLDKIDAQKQRNTQVQKDKKTEYNREYYRKNREKINAHERELWAKKWEKNKDYINRKRREKYPLVREKILEHNKQWYHNNLDHVHEYDRQRRINNKEARAEASKRAISKKPEYYKAYKQTWYQDNKEDILEKGKQNYLKFKQQIECAKNVCPAFVFLVNLRKTNLKKYLELYTRQQKPLKHMLKTCAALQKMDINMCPICNLDYGQKMYECCNPKVLSIPNVMDELAAIVNNLKQR